MDPLPPVSMNHMLAPTIGGQPYDYVVHALYAHHDTGACVVFI